MKFVYNTLDSWVMHEYNRDELIIEVLGTLYCPGPRFEPEEPVGPPVLVERLETVKGILVMHFPLSKALHELMRELDRAGASICKWEGKPRGKVYRGQIPPNGIRLRRRA